MASTKSLEEDPDPDAEDARETASRHLPPTAGACVH